MQGTIDKDLAHGHFMHLAAMRAMDFEFFRPRRAEAFNVYLDGGGCPLLGVWAGENRTAIIRSRRISGGSTICLSVIGAWISYRGR
jgi:hypothetical protein